MGETQFPETVIDWHQIKLVNEAGHKQVENAVNKGYKRLLDHYKKALDQLLHLVTPEWENLKADHQMYRKDATILPLDNN